jgi:hypothetical protein
MKFLIVTVVSVLFLSCKNDRNESVSHNLYEDPEDFCQMILKMHKDDQKFREIMVDPFFEISDSIKKAKGIEKIYKDFTEEKQLAYGRIARAIADKRKRKFTEKQEDSLMQLQIIIDNQNTELLIDIIKKRGFPDLPECKGGKFTSMVFRHSQPEYWDEIKILIEKEYKEGRMNTGQFKIVLNHINGREDFKITKERYESVKIN